MTTDAEYLLAACREKIASKPVRIQKELIKAFNDGRMSGYMSAARMIGDSLIDSGDPVLRRVARDYFFPNTQQIQMEFDAKAAEEIKKLRDALRPFIEASAWVPKGYKLKMMIASDVDGPAECNIKLADINRARKAFGGEK